MPHFACPTNDSPNPCMLLVWFGTLCKYKNGHSFTDSHRVIHFGHFNEFNREIAKTNDSAFVSLETLRVHFSIKYFVEGTICT